MEGTWPSYSQEYCTKTARVEMPVLQARTSRSARERPEINQENSLKNICFNAENLNNSHEDSNISFLLFTAHPHYGSSSVNELPQYLGTDENSTN